MAMNGTTSQDLDYLGARLHGRRSRLAEGPRLASLCLLKTVPALGHAIAMEGPAPPRATPLPDTEFQSAPSFQRWLVHSLSSELSGFIPCLNKSEARLLGWIALHDDLANLKVGIRAILARATSGIPDELLRELPAHGDMKAAFVAAPSLDSLARLLPEDPLGRMLKTALQTCPDRTEPFFIEASLDHDYFRQGLDLASALPGPDRENITDMIAQEADIFHLMLAMRGRFNYGLKPEMLSPLHVRGTRLSHSQFTAMLAAPAPSDLPSLETQAWARYHTLANRTFRQSATDFGTVVGYCGLRRMEAANLTTLSEGIRAGLTEEALRRRMIPSLLQEAPHV